MSDELLLDAKLAHSMFVARSLHNGRRIDAFTSIPDGTFRLRNHHGEVSMREVAWFPDHSPSAQANAIECGRREFNIGLHALRSSTSQFGWTAADTLLTLSDSLRCRGEAALADELDAFTVDNVQTFHSASPSAPHPRRAALRV